MQRCTNGTAKKVLKGLKEDQGSEKRKINSVIRLEWKYCSGWEEGMEGGRKEEKKRLLEERLDV